MRRLGLGWLTGFAGRLFLWFWLVLTLMLVANVQLSRHLRSNEELRPAIPQELEELAGLRDHLRRFAERPKDALIHSKSARFLVLFDARSLQPLERRRPRHWRIPELVASDNGVQVLEQGQEGWAVLNQTPFYGESGGQAGECLWRGANCGGFIAAS